MSNTGLAYQVLLYYLLAINTLSYVLFALDKGYSQRGEKRIAEKTLFAVSILGGSLGSLLAMYQFSHKTRHLSFKYGLPMILILQLVLASYYYIIM